MSRSSCIVNRGIHGLMGNIRLKLPSSPYSAFTPRRRNLAPSAKRYVQKLEMGTERGEWVRVKTTVSSAHHGTEGEGERGDKGRGFFAMHGLGIRRNDRNTASLLDKKLRDHKLKKKKIVTVMIVINSMLLAVGQQ